MLRVSCSTARACRGVEGVELGPVPFELQRADVVDVGAQRSDDRRDLARGAVDAVTIELLGDDLAHVPDLLAPLRERLLAEGAEVVDVEQRHAEHLARTGVDVAGHADVDDEQRRDRRAPA